MIDAKKILIILITITFLVGCSAAEEAKTTTTPIDDVKNDGNQEPASTNPTTESTKTQVVTTGWRDTTITDVNTNTQFKISDFKDKKVLLEVFAVWCPLCTKQQNIMKQFHKDNPDIISVSLDADPNEDAEQVKAHATSHGFDWKYSVSPIEMTRSLIKEFGQGISAAPTVPVILICEDQTARKLGRGVKDADTLTQEIAKGC